jgi:putative ATP-dependent endonuclease of OLD family
LSQVRHIHIKNFRAIKELEWLPKPGLNCLIGPGDSGKSTILDAIDLALGARRSYPFTDADFFELNTDSPIEIWVTLGALNDQLKNIDVYGMFLRSFNSSSGTITDEPQTSEEIVLTLKLTVGADLDADWLLYSERAESEGTERRLPWKHRELVTPARLGVASNQHLAWGSRSVLNKLSEDSFDISSTLAQLSRSAREAFSEHQIEGVDNVLTQVKTIANNLGVPVGDLKASLDVNSVSLSHGAISLHNNDNTPLRQLGTGSARLLISGLQKVASASKILIVDEAEYGLEPYRISRLLNELGSKSEEPLQQVFITTHSPFVLRELKAEQLHVLRKRTVAEQAFSPPYSHKIYSLNGGDEQQATLRACAEAFFSRAVIVGEGSTEVGIVRGLDLYKQDIQQLGIQAQGASCTDGGGGTNYFKRAEIFASLGYPTALLKDSDITTAAHQTQTQYCSGKGVRIFEWGHGLSTEGAIFSLCRIDLIPHLVKLASELNGQQEVDQHIKNKSAQKFNYDLCIENSLDTMRLPLAEAASHYKWFKNIVKAETLSRTIVCPNTQLFPEHFQNILTELLSWVEMNGDVR